MYEHKLNPDLLSSYATADYINNETAQVTQAQRDERDADDDQKWWTDTWYNSTNVTGIRTLRFRIFDANQATTDRYINAIIGLLKPLHPDSWQTFTYKSSVWELRPQYTEQQAQDAIANVSDINNWDLKRYNETYAKYYAKVQKYGKHNVLMIYYRSNKLGEKIPWDKLHPREQAYREGRHNKLAHAYHATFVPGKIVTIRDDLNPKWHEEIPAQYFGKQGMIISVDPKCNFTIRMLVEGFTVAQIANGEPVGRTLKVYRYDVVGYNFRLIAKNYRPYLNGQTDVFPTFD